MDVLMTRVDVQHGLYGSNMFLQLENYFNVH